ncbi:alanine racemase [Salinisphaera sp. LB1]|uniref:alanine racemase n=1 Tax=Salinisphaera sp. LB1 TaxID=2183911 RepID=UPI000D707A70|nr:alanine racemase [Salinisphaera sp. LB1]AWN17661.1 Alanine racemase [Salinisphaera sp. LB1]
MRALATIDRAALAHNLERVRALAPGCEVYAAVKADGYGHGAATVANALAAADGFAVSSLDEAMQLRWSGITQPIMTLSQPLDVDACALAAAHDVRPVVFDRTHLAALADYVGPVLSVWIKLDSGMHRLGFAPGEAAAVAAHLREMRHVHCVGWLTHLGCADDPSNPMTERQLAAFARGTAEHDGQRSIANSAGVLAWPAAHADVVRPGIMLYGSSPMVDATAADHDLRPAMHLTAPIISRRRVVAGEPIGYGATWRAPEDMDVGVIGIGYGDGYPRHAPSGTPVLVRGVRAALVGRVSMDMITVDLRAVPEAGVGDRVTLWGPGLPADEVAAAAGTIAYELFCRLTARVSVEIV